ncbi:hypothetical protein ABBQ32_011264 [Trebouxia sp. C0010 RCD-2024]
MGKDKSSKKDRKDKKRKRDKEDEEDYRKAKAEKLAKKVASHLKKHSGGHGYTDQDNPFGDSNVTERFVWGKKLEKQIQSGVGVKDLGAKAEKRRQEDRLEEIEKVKKRRLDREKERADQEEMLNVLQRERGIAEAVELERKEEEFHLEQAKMRAKQRIRDGRPHPIDILTANLHLAEEFDVGADEPYKAFEGLSLQQVQELHASVISMQELDSQDPVHKEFWDALLVIAEVELQEAVKQDELDWARLRGEAIPAKYTVKEAGLHEAVDSDVQMMLAGKTHAQLQHTQASIEQQLQSGEAADPEFSAAILKRLRIHKAKAKLREIHSDLLQQHLDRTQHVIEDVDVAQEMGWEQEGAQEAAGKADPASSSPLGGPSHAEEGPATAADGNGTAAPPLNSLQQQWAPEPEEEDEEEEEENVGQWSPVPLDAQHIGNQDVVHEDEDQRLIDLLRKQVQYKEASRFRAAASAAAAGVASGLNEADRAYRQMVSDPSSSIHPMLRYLADAAPQKGEASMRSGAQAPDDDSTRQFKAQSQRLMGDMNDAGDAPFGGEVQVDSQVYWWHDKYRPRKPKYFNRVHTGYEWNKYNQTHYDHDNPPPKVVQGYKFNIFYPDLIDKLEAPTYSLEKDPGADEHGSTCMLRIHAGPPYEDCAFRIINKEWEYSHKKGFKCTFERGILHLYFNFKRQRYRR